MNLGKYWLLLPFFCIFCRTVHAEYSCRQIFTPETSSRSTLSLPGTPSQSTPEKTQTSRNDPNRSSEIDKDPLTGNEIYRDRRLIHELYTNKIFSLVSSPNSMGGKDVWFLATNSRGRLYRLVFRQDKFNKNVETFADTPSAKMEQNYYKIMAENYNANLTFEVNLPRKGRRDLVIKPEVAIKLAVKHNMTVEELVKAIRSVPKGVRYHPNNATAYAGKESFIFFIEMGARTPLEVVIVFENNAYQLVTAFFPEVYRF